MEDPMRQTMSVMMAVMVLTRAGAAAQDTRPTRAEMNEIAGRWIGTVKAEMGEMPIALDLKAGETELTGSLETGHGNWSVLSVKKKSADWVVAIKTPDGLEGTMTGRIKDGRLSGDWNFKPRATGTFELIRPAKK
jgi:hypothetical protein